MSIQEAFVEYRALFQHIVSLLLLAAMLRWGAAPERSVAVTFVGLFVLPILILEPLVGRALILVDGGLYYAAIDIVAAIAFIVIALNANRNYALWLAGFQLVAVSAHGVRYVTDAVSPIAHATMVIAPSYLQLLFMAIGLIRHVQREKRYGKYRDWRAPRREIDFAALTRGPG
jgi:hypothetical protein